MSAQRKEQQMKTAIYVTELDRDTVQEFADELYLTKGQLVSYMISLLRTKKIDLSNFYSKLD